MKTSLEIRIGQQLTMTPQLQQAIRLLQMSTLDLQQEIQQAVESNPLLEIEESSDDAEPATSESEDTADLDFDQMVGDAEDLDTESRWDEALPSTGSSNAPTDDLIDQRNSAIESLADHLEWQLNLTRLSDRDKAIGIVIIDDLNSEGYLQSSLADLAAACQQTLGIADCDIVSDPDLAIEEAEVEAVLHTIQRLDPLGVGARNLQECLLLQLEQPELPRDVAELARNLIANHMDALAHTDLDGLGKLAHADRAGITAALALIRQLDPRPGLQITPSETGYVIPDVIVRKRRGRWVAELNQENLPRLRINDTYAGLIRRADNSTDNTYLRNQLQEARWFIKSVESRNDTLLKVANTIIHYQRGYFDYGAEAMRPMVLHDIAEAIGMHESTVSRVTTQKYMLTPHGIVELKFFFSSHVSTAMGGECSSTAIRALIRKLVGAENPKKPLSDARIATLLQEQGIEVARRTVAKYRESLNIPASSDRKRLI